MSSVFIIAEAGVNHNGDMNLAKRLVDVAVEAGVDAVKFQTWKTELIVTKEAKQAEYQSVNTGIIESQYDMLKKLELSYENFREIKEYCDSRNIIFMSTPDEVESANFLSGLQDIFKIGSGELTNIPFLRHIGQLCKEVILSTGMSRLGEIEDALNALIVAGTPKEKITLLHATTEYPCSIEEVNLKAMLTIGAAFQIRVGYSDHTKGIDVPIAAAAIGATVIEKHFTLDCSMEGPDHKASLEPHELKVMVKSIRRIELAMGDGIKRVTPSEAKNILIVRKSIVSRLPIQKGATFTVENLTTKRPGTGISPIFWEKVLGRTAYRNFDVDDLIEL